MYSSKDLPFVNQRLVTKEVTIGDLLLGNLNPIRVQTMTTTDTMDTIATVEQTIRCIEAGAELVRITAPSKREADNLLEIKNELRKRGYTTPLVADIHFTPNAAEIAARIVEKVRVNPGNYVDKKKFEQIEYTDAEYAAEIERIATRFTPLVKICKEYGTAMRIGTNHGSLSDRIMSRYGDTPMGMVESAMEFLRIARNESYHNIVLSMKSSNPQVMVQAYRLLVETMYNEFGECYPLHLGVTEAGDGEDGRIKSAIGIGTLLDEGIGDTIRVSLTEDPELEIPVCKDLVARVTKQQTETKAAHTQKSAIAFQEYKRRESKAVDIIGGTQVPVVIADFSEKQTITPTDLESIGYQYNVATDKWNIKDAAADFVYTKNKILDFALPGTLKVIIDADVWSQASDKEKYFPLQSVTNGFTSDANFHFIKCSPLDLVNEAVLQHLKSIDKAVIWLHHDIDFTLTSFRNAFSILAQQEIKLPVVLNVQSSFHTPDEHLIHFSTELGALLLDGKGDGIMLSFTDNAAMQNVKVSGRTYLPVSDKYQFVNNTAFSVLQATRTRISKTEYISCPSCGRTLFDLQDTTAMIRNRTHHLKGIKIAIMGCIVNGPGEMADADFGYVGSGPGKITLYKGKEVVKKNVNSEVAVEELIALLKENDAWIEP